MVTPQLFALRPPPITSPAMRLAGPAPDSLLWRSAERGLRSLSGRGLGAARSALLDVTLQVEVWLNRLLERMRSTLRNLIPQALGTYEEKPREQWVFDYPAQVGAAAQGQAEPGLSRTGGGDREPGEAQAPTLSHCRFLLMPCCPHGLLQVALTCTQIAWTSEVGVAFASLEKGYENALKDYNKKQVGIIST